jgi:hypothetical protein
LTDAPAPNVERRGQVIVVELSGPKELGYLSLAAPACFPEFCVVMIPSCLNCHTQNFSWSVFMKQADGEATSMFIR